MAIANLTQLDGIFKRNYNEGSDVLIKQQNLTAPMWGKWKKSPLKPSAQGIYNPVTMQGNENGGAINEEEAFQEPTSIIPIQASITSKTVVWPFQITGKVIRLSETDKVAFAKGLDAQQQDNLGRMYSDLNRQSWGTGTGQIDTAVGSGSGATALVVNNPFVFRVGMILDSYASLGGAKEIGATTSATITAINYSTATLTITPAQTWSNATIICKKNVLNGVTSLANAKELTGWRAICDTTTFSTTFEGVPVSTYGQWQGNVVNAGTAPISQDLLQRTFNQGAIIGGEKPDMLVSNYGQARTFLNTELQKTRYEGGEVDAGNVVLKWGTMEWMIDWTYPINEVGMMVKDGIQKFQTNDVKLSDLPGQGLYQIVGRDAIGGYYVYEGNLGTWKRNNQNRLTGLTEPTF